MELISKIINKLVSEIPTKWYPHKNNVNNCQFKKNVYLSRQKCGRANEAEIKVFFLIP